MEEQLCKSINDSLYKRLNKANNPFLIAGPCVVESADHSLFMAEKLKKITENHNIDFIFKSSFDKANRTRLKNYRGVGLEKSIQIFQNVMIFLGNYMRTDILL